MTYVANCPSKGYDKPLKLLEITVPEPWGWRDIGKSRIERMSSWVLALISGTT